MLIRITIKIQFRENATIKFMWKCRRLSSELITFMLVAFSLSPPQKKIEFCGNSKRRGKMQMQFY